MGNTQVKFQFGRRVEVWMRNGSWSDESESKPRHSLNVVRGSSGEISGCYLNAIFLYMKLKKVLPNSTTCPLWTSGSPLPFVAEV
jgi:hypothetical protein